jgi:hypothetical protein
MKEKNLTAIQLGLVLLFALLIFTRRVREQFQTGSGPNPIGMRVSGSQAGIIAAQPNGLVANVLDSATGTVLMDEGINELINTDTTVKLYDLILLSTDPITVDLTKINTPIEQGATDLPLVLKNYILFDSDTNTISYNPPLEVATATTTAAPTTTTTAAPTTTTTAAPTTTTTAAPTTAAPTTTAPTTAASTTAAPTTTAPTTTASTTAASTTAAPTTAAPTASTAGTTPMGTTQAKKEDEGLSTGAIVAISLGSIVMATAGLFVIFRSKTV